MNKLAVSQWQGGRSAIRDGRLAIANCDSITIAKDWFVAVLQTEPAITNPQILTAYVCLFMNYRANAQFAQTLQQTTCTTLPSYILTYTCSVCVLKIESQADENSDELRTRNELRTKQQADMVHYKLIELRILQEQKMNCSITVIP
jgi:hypothetical protein